MCPYHDQLKLSLLSFYHLFMWKNNLEICKGLWIVNKHPILKGWCILLFSLATECNYTYKYPKFDQNPHFSYFFLIINYVYFMNNYIMLLILSPKSFVRMTNFFLNPYLSKAEAKFRGAYL